MADEKDKEIKKINWSPEKVMSISALFVSLISLIALFYQLGLAREENELIRKQQSASVLPHLRLSPSLTSDSYNMVFANQGVGPAFIKKVEFTINDSLVFQRSDFFMTHISDEIYKSDSVRIRMTTYSFMEGDVIPANSEISILDLNGEIEVELFFDYLDVIKWSYTILYEDIYGARWNLGSENRFPVPVSEEK